MKPFLSVYFPEFPPGALVSSHIQNTCKVDVLESLKCPVVYIFILSVALMDVTCASRIRASCLKLK